MQKSSSTGRPSAARVRQVSRIVRKETRALSRERNVQGAPPGAVALATQHKPTPRCPPCEPLLHASFHGHQSAVLKVLFLKDADGVQEFVTSSMDKTVKYWHVSENDIGGTVISLQTVEEGPVFSLALDTHTQDRPRAVFCGTANKDVVSWEAPAPRLVPRSQLCMSGHSGWVKDLAIEGRWLFSCGCNKLLQWDLAWPAPKVVGEIELFTGDIQCICTLPGRVVVACANGSLRAWTLAKNGAMEAAGEVLDAHPGRILALVHNAGVLYTAGSDGSLKAWSADTFELLQEIPAAHDGQKINCAAVSAEGVLYTGGNDNCIRAWRLPSLAPCAEPIHHHEEGVRALAVSSLHLVSADSGGKISLWEIASKPCKTSY